MSKQQFRREALSNYFNTSSIGSVDRPLSNNLYGINHRQITTKLPWNKDQFGYTFFVRPQLNLQSSNIRNVRKFYSLLTNNPTTIQRFVRATLDPRIMYGYDGIEKLTCPLVDNEQAFIPVLSNNLLSLSGFPDLTLPTHTSKPGLYNEVYSQVDGLMDYYESYDITATYMNVKGDPILYLLYIWEMYSSYVFQGLLNPYLDFITENEIDYNTRIYRIVVDTNKEVVTKIGSTGVSFPISVPTGSLFDYNKTGKPFNLENKEISIRFKCLGAQYFDDILIIEFNKTVSQFNPSMAEDKIENDMEKISSVFLTLFNNRGYPRINLENNKLEWWVKKEEYQRIVSRYGADIERQLIKLS